MKKLIPLALLSCLGIAACIHFNFFLHLPEDIPTMPGMKVLSQISLKSPPARQWLIEVEEDRHALFNYYKSQLQPKGWMIRVDRPDFLAFYNHRSGFMISADRLEDGRTRAELFIGKM